MSAYVLPMDDVVDTYLKLSPERYPQAGRNVVFDEVEVLPAKETKYSLQIQPADSSWLALNNRYENTTSVQQEFRVRAERTTHNKLFVDLETSIQMDGRTRVALNAPTGSGTQEFSSPVIHVPTVKGKAFEEAVVWSIDCPIKVSPKHIGTVQTKLEEKRYEGTFKQETRVSGYITIKMHDQYQNFLRAKRVKVVEMFRVLRDEHDLNYPGVTIKEDFVLFVVKGSCSFQLTIDQKMRVEEKKL